MLPGDIVIVAFTLASLIVQFFWARSADLGRAALWGFVPPFFVIITVLILNNILALPSAEKLETHVKDPYRAIFVIGILVSLWAQSAVTCYFDDRGLFHSTKIAHSTTIAKFFEKGLRFEIPLLLGFSVLVCLMTISEFRVHFFANLFYLVVVLIIDFTYGYRGESRSNDEDCTQKSADFKKYCQRLFVYIDFLPLMSLMTAFMFVSAVSADHTMHVFMSGVIGFHLIVTFLSIGGFLIEWEQQERLKAHLMHLPRSTRQVDNDK